MRRSKKSFVNVLLLQLQSNADVVTVYDSDGTTTLTELSSSTLQSLQTTGPEFTVTFRTDSSITYQGFVFSYDQCKPELVTFTELLWRDVPFQGKLLSLPRVRHQMRSGLPMPPASASAGPSPRVPTIQTVRTATGS